jgi:hypothetical protein
VAIVDKNVSPTVGNIVGAAGLSQSYNTVLGDDLVLFWDFEETGEPWIDQTSNGYNLTKLGATDATQSATNSGAGDYSARLTLSDGLETSKALDFGTGDFTIGGWVRWDSGGNEDMWRTRAGAWGTASTPGLVLDGGNYASTMRFETGTGIQDVDGNYANLPGRVSAGFGSLNGSWGQMLVVVDRTANEMRLWGQGVLRYTLDITAVTGSVNSVQYNFQWDKAACYVDNWGVWTRAFSADDVAVHYNSGVSLDHASL